MKIFVIGWFGAGNMGDEAILMSELLTFRSKINNAEFYILSFDTERTKRLTAKIPEVKKILRMGSKINVIRSDFRGIFKAFRDADLVVIGGGGIFQDIYNHYPIPFFTILALTARFAGKRPVLYCLGIGPVNTYIGKKLCRIAANSSGLVSVRDRESMDLLRRLGVTKKIYLSSDPVFLLDPVKNHKTQKTVKLLKHDNRSGPVIGVCIQDLLFWHDRKRRMLAEILDILCLKKGANIVFLPFGAYHDEWFLNGKKDSIDVTASKKIAAMMKGNYSILADELAPQELLAVIEKMDLIISMRLHGLIMGLATERPVLALTYKEETKIKNLMKRFNQEDSLFFVDRVEKEELRNRIEYLLTEKNIVRKQINSRLLPVREKASRFNDVLINTLPKESQMIH